MQGRDPRDAWAFTQRICGVCTVVHAVASCRAVEDALDIKIPANANTDPEPRARDAVHPGPRHPLLPPARARLGRRGERPQGRSGRRRPRSPRRSRPGRTTRRPTSREVQDRLKKFVAGGQLGIFTNGYWGHPAYKLPPEVNLLAVAHYLEALDWQRDVIRLHTIFGGKNPHPELPRRRDGVGDQSRRHGHDQRRATHGHPRHDHSGAASSWSRCTGPTSWPSRASTRTGRRWAAGCRTTWPWANFPRETSARPNALLPARNRARAGPHQGLAVRPEPGEGVHHQLVVRVLERRRGRTPPV